MIRTALTRLIAAIAAVYLLLIAQAFTKNGPELEAFVDLGRETAIEDLPPVDQLRSLCSVEWPTEVAGIKTAEARRKACRVFGE
ncbi:MAG: hypothetical protein GY734_08350 [Herbaspirillum sp.]|uniref:hypothetical protein n=1 Tax=Herbaspirillum sp. TaxID=1890675 RepID=UPI002582BFDF|nr:hypothetical protein [Herbaspirillum sp.]MCP3653348.1 hypothetical protein [Herbaspirillum sp.]MCP3946760.1 hypothetical protein [Herbaspirillum sp.]MCP4031236.1 hypothetical protein [Herbaspirillum sp.]MCP4554381.1 hypothetical protein [Herbaspirillum sp.]